MQIQRWAGEAIADLDTVGSLRFVRLVLRIESITGMTTASITAYIRKLAKDGPL